MEDRTITLIDDNGKEVKAQILFTYHHDELNKNYVVFMVNGQASAAQYFDEGNGEGRLGDIQTEEEWEMLNDILEDFMNNQKEGACGGCSGCECNDGSEGCGSNCSCNCEKN